MLTSAFLLLCDALVLEKTGSTSALIPSSKCMCAKGLGFVVWERRKKRKKWREKYVLRANDSHTFL